MALQGINNQVVSEIKIVVLINLAKDYKRLVEKALIWLKDCDSRPVF